MQGDGLGRAGEGRVEERKGDGEGEGEQRTLQKEDKEGEHSPAPRSER